jgi:hypothetical protein
MDNDKGVFDILFMSDEANFQLFGYVNEQYSRYWIDNNHIQVDSKGF